MKRFILGPLQIDAEQRVLYKGSAIVNLPPKSLDILLVLIENAGQVVSRDTIRRDVWQDAFIEDANITNHISLLRIALKECLGEDAQPIRTLPKRGYQFTEPVEVLELHESHFASQEKEASVVAASQQRADRSENSPTPRESYKTADAGHSNAQKIIPFLCLLFAALAISMSVPQTAHMLEFFNHPTLALTLKSKRVLNLYPPIRPPFAHLVWMFVIPSMAAVLVLLRRTPHMLNAGNWLIALLINFCVQMPWVGPDTDGVHHTVDLLGQFAAAMLLAWYCRKKTTARENWAIVMNSLPMIMMLSLYGLHIDHWVTFTTISGVGILLAAGTFLLLRQHATLMRAVGLAWFVVAALSFFEMYRSAVYLPIAAILFYAVLNLFHQLPANTIGKWAMLGATTFRAVFAAAHPLIVYYGKYSQLSNEVFEMQRFVVPFVMLVILLEAQAATSKLAAVDHPDATWALKLPTAAE